MNDDTTVDLTIHRLAYDQALEFAACYGKMGYSATITVLPVDESSPPLENSPEHPTL
jgi:hypothetical protein